MDPQQPTENTVPEVQTRASYGNKKGIIIGIAAVLLLVLGGVVYAKVIVPKNKEHAAALAKKQEEDTYQLIKSKVAAGGPVTRAEYQTYLNHEVDYSAWIPSGSVTAAAGAFTLQNEADYGGGLAVFGPELLPGDTYILLSSVTTTSGPETLDTFENADKDIFHKVDDYTKVDTSSGSYFKGMRGLHIDSDISSVVQITGTIVVPFYDNVEKVTLANTDTKKLLGTGALEDIVFDGNKFEATYTGTASLLSIVAYGKNGNKLEYQMETSTGDVTSPIAGEYDEAPVKVELTFGLSVPDISIPFSMTMPTTQTSTVKPKQDQTTKAADVSTNIPWVPDTNPADKKNLQKTIGDFATLFQKGDIGQIKDYIKLTGIDGNDPNSTDADVKKVIDMIAPSLRPLTEAKIASTTSVTYEKGVTANNEIFWRVGGLSVIDPFFGDSVTATITIKMINGKQYVVNFLTE